MLQCKHKWEYIVLNRSLKTWFCSKHQKSVNDDICSECPDREGVCLKPPVEGFEFPSRTEEEIQAIYSVCKACPLHDLITKQCKGMKAEPHPTDVVAQHPSNHCPENLW